MHSPTDQERLRRAGHIAAAVREAAVARIRDGAKVLELCSFVEREIQARGGEPAFPAQISCNVVAAHDCPSPQDQRTLSAGDIVKLDLGVHVDGHVVDTAATRVIDGPGEDRRRALAEASLSGLWAVIEALRPGMLVREVARTAETVIRAAGFLPVRGLSGHGVGRWKVHCPPAIPNVEDEAEPQTRIQSDTILAIEVFATTGLGSVQPRGPAEVLSASDSVWTIEDADIERTIRGFHGLPFSRRQLGDFEPPRVEAALMRLRSLGVLRGYPPLVEKSGGDVSQAEHTIVVREHEVEVLTVLDTTAAIL